MAVIETWLRQDLKGLVTVRSLQGQVFSLDNGGNLIGVKVTKDGQPVTLTGTVTGYCILSDGQTVTVTGSGKSGIQNGNEAYIVLPQLVYSVPGQISIVIKLTSASVTTTLAACTGYVYRSRTSNEVVPPGTPIPDLATMEEVIRRATAATDAANTAATGAEKVDASMTKEGDIITITVTDRDGNVTEKTVTDQSEAMKRKADVNGYYEELAVGTADQLASTEAVTDTTPYLYRKSGGSADVGNREALEKIVGGTVCWNQLVTSNLTTRTFNGITWTNNNDGTFTANGLAEADSYIDVMPVNSGLKDHIIFIGGCPSGGSVSSYAIFQPYITYTITVDYGSGRVSKTTSPNATCRLYIFSGFTADNLVFKPQFFDLTAMFGPTIADYVYGLEQATPGAGVAWFRKLFPKDYYSYNAGELISVKPVSHDMVGFNAWDEEWELGTYLNATGAKYKSSTKIRNKNPISVLPNTAYFWYVGSTSADEDRIWCYDSEMNFIRSFYISHQATVSLNFTTPNNCAYVNFSINNTTYNHDICINLSNSGTRDGEYEPYEKHSYSLADVELRGPLAIDADGKLVYSGDEYTPDGQVKRKYGVVDLGTLAWTLGSGASGVNRFYSTSLSGSIKKPVSNSDVVNAVCAKYTTVSENSGYTGALGFSTNTNGVIAVYGETNYATADAFRTAMSGVMLVYELATPTIEQAAPYTSVQVVDDWGTEEFVNTREVAIPVGHSTSYMANLRDKLQHLPSLAEEDGEYIVKQTGTKMELAKFSSVGVASAIVETTESLPVVSVKDGADGQPMRKVEVDIEPVQDLHGYDAPWPAGGGKNLIDSRLDNLMAVNSSGTWNDNVYTLNGLTFTISEDGHIVINGTSTANTFFTVYRNSEGITLPSGSYVLHKSGSADIIVAAPKNGSYWASATTSDSVVTLTESAMVSYYVQIQNGKTISNYALYPMFESGSTPTSWTPYSNICPITGWTGAKVTRTGKNLLDYTPVSGSVHIEQLLKAGYTYTCTAERIDKTRNSFLYLYKADDYEMTENVIRISYIIAGTNEYNATFTAEAGKYYTLWGGSSIDNATNVQLELGSVATAYEPYQGQTYEVTFPSEAGTVYGGTLDVASGKLVVDRMMVQIRAAINKSLDGNDNYFWYSSAGTLSIPVIKELNAKLISNRMTKTANVTSLSPDGFVAFYTNGIIRWKEQGTLTLSEYNSYLSEDPLEICYEIATPITYTLTPQEIKTLLSTNNIWSDAGNTAVTYPADTKLYIDNKIAELQALILENNG